MPNKDTSELKQKIVNILKVNGPSLPVHIAKQTGLSILFTSAFLSELISEKKIKTSNLRVGSSALHFLEGQEQKLINFSHFLKSKEKEAYEKLKTKKFLKDAEQEPAIRVALRAIKDFAKPFKDNDELFWRFFDVSESEFKPKVKFIPKPLPSPKEDDLGIFDKEKEIVEEKKSIEVVEKKSEKPKKRKSSSRKNEKFFDKVKEHLFKKNIEIIGIEGFNKTDLVLRVKEQDKESLLVAFNKKRITDLDIVKASKKAKEFGLNYILLSLGEPLKKTNNLIEAIKFLNNIEKIE